MRKSYIVLLIFLGIFESVFSQEFLWKAGLHAFFDNCEFTGSRIKESQTMAGVHLAPELGLGWNEKHRIFAGVDLMREFGSDKFVDYSDLIAYHEFDQKPFRFYMGAFPRRMALEKYPRMFFQDSILNYRPIVTGIFWEYYSGENFLNAWLDWTGRQTRERNEAFFVGLSGRYNLNMFYGQLFSYMYHFAAKEDPVVPEGLHDNGLVWASLGIDLTKKTNFDRLEANVGWTTGLERDRSIGEWHTPQGFLSEIKVEYKGLGLFNTYYMGGKQQVFYGSHGNEIYWGDPLYRSTGYNRADFYVYFVKTNVVNLKFIYSLHFVEKEMYHEQLFYATFDLSNLKRKEEKKYQYIWDNWFNREE